MLRSGIPIELSPLNVSRKTSFTRQSYEQLVAADTPITRLIRAQMGPIFAATPNRKYLMYDEVTVASVVDPTLVKTELMVVDVDITHGINYGVSVGGKSVWPGAEGAQKMAVQYDVDWERFMRLFVDRAGTAPK